MDDTDEDEDGDASSSRDKEEAFQQLQEENRRLTELVRESQANCVMLPPLPPVAEAPAPRAPSMPPPG
eukprot:5081960-Lingulodinium_polyedra.AAC.1